MNSSVNRQRIARHPAQRAIMRLVIGGARQVDAQCLVEEMARETAAVEPGIDAVSARAVRAVEEVHCRDHQFGGGIAPRCTRQGRCGRRGTRLAAAVARHPLAERVALGTYLSTEP